MMTLPTCEACQVPSNRWDEVVAAWKECAEATAVAAIRKKSMTSRQWMWASPRADVEMCMIRPSGLLCEQASNATRCLASAGLGNGGELDSGGTGKGGLRQGANLQGLRCERHKK